MNQISIVLCKFDDCLLVTLCETNLVGFRLIFHCQPSDLGGTVGMTASINLTSSQGEELCPILFYFSKRCRSEGKEIGRVMNRNLYCLLNVFIVNTLMPYG